MFLGAKASLQTPSISNLGRPEIAELYKYRPRWLPPAIKTEMVERYVDSKGQVKIKGGRDLKQSQSYPLQHLACIVAILFLIADAV